MAFKRRDMEFSPERIKRESGSEHRYNQSTASTCSVNLVSSWCKVPGRSHRCLVFFPVDTDRILKLVTFQLFAPVRELSLSGGGDRNKAA